MFRVLILQASHSLSDERTDYLIKDPRASGTSCRSRERNTRGEDRGA
jgi:hypothetical protein